MVSIVIRNINEVQTFVKFLIKNFLSLNEKVNILYQHVKHEKFTTLVFLPNELQDIFQAEVLSTEDLEYLKRWLDVVNDVLEFYKQYTPATRKFVEKTLYKRVFYTNETGGSIVFTKVLWHIIAAAASKGLITYGALLQQVPKKDEED